MLLNSQTVLVPLFFCEDTGCLIIFEQYLSGENPRVGLFPPCLGLYPKSVLAGVSKYEYYLLPWIISRFPVTIAG